MKGKDILLVTLVMIIWGVNFSAIKLGVTQLDPLIVAAARFFFATFPIIFFVRRPPVAWKYLLAYGLIFGTGIWGMASCAITFGLSSGMASVLLQMDVITSVLIGVWLYKEKVSLQMGLGITIALAGLIISVMYTNGNITLLGVIFIFISAIFWPLAGVVIRASGTKAAFSFNIWGMLFAPVPLFFLSLVINGFDGLMTTIENWNGQVWFSILFQAYPTTVFGYWVWNKMVLKYPMSKLAPMTLLTSVFALLSGFMIYGEQLSTIQWISCSAFLLGILMVLSPTARFIKSSSIKGESAQE
ncbi:EamA family transporter [Vibrio sp.]|nr:EamA family transporter [Vibrio sp.]